MRLRDKSEPSDRRRSRRFMLKFAVLVRGNTPDGRRVQVEAFTLEVNAHGGLFEALLELTTNQRITVINPQTRKKVGCRVVRIGKSSSTQFQVAFECEQSSAHFWPFSFLPPRIGV
jgi:hypothetical protein